MSIIAGLLLIVSGLGLIKLHREKGKEIVHAKWFNKRNCIIGLVVALIVGGLASQGSPTTTTSTPATKQSGTSTWDQAKVQVAKDEAKKKADKVAADALHVKNIIPDTQIGIGKILEMKTDNETNTSGAIKVLDTNNQYVINYSYAPLGGADKLNQELGVMLATKIHNIYTSYSNVDKLKFVISVPLSDKYGNTTWTPYRSFEFSRALNNKINWTSDTFDKGTLIDLSENVQNIK